MKNKKKDTIITETSCYNHKCTKCGKKLQSTKWWQHIIIFGCIIGFFGGFMWVLNTISPMEEQSICGVEERIHGIEEDTGRSIYKQEFIKCGNFIAN